MTFTERYCIIQEKVFQRAGLIFVTHLRPARKSQGDFASMHLRNKAAGTARRHSQKFTTAASARLNAAMAVCMGILALIAAAVMLEGLIPVGFVRSGSLLSPVYGASGNRVSCLGDSVNVTLDFGSSVKMLNRPITSVVELLEGEGLFLDDNDKINVKLTDTVYEDMVISIDKVDSVDIEVYEVIPFETEINELQTIPRGQVEVLQTGSDGAVTKKLHQTYENGRLIEETILEEIVHKEAVKEIRNVGVGGTVIGADGTHYRYSYYVDVLATAYGGEEFSGLTYTGKQVEIGMIAVDPDVIPLRSKVYLRNTEGDIDLGVMSAEDTGSLIKGAKIDIFTGPDEAGVAAATKFGRKYIRVYVLE